MRISSIDARYNKSKKQRALLDKQLKSDVIKMKTGSYEVQVNNLDYKMNLVRHQVKRLKSLVESRESIKPEEMRV